MLDYPALAALAAVIREGSFERAALALHVTPSAVSQRIRLLEERVGCALVVRGQPCQATDTGRRLCQHVDRVRLLEQELQGALPALAPEGIARVALPIAVNADSLATWFAPALAAFAAERRARVELLAGEHTGATEIRDRNAVVLGRAEYSDAAAALQPADGWAVRYVPERREVGIVPLKGGAPSFFREKGGTTNYGLITVLTKPSDGGAKRTILFAGINSDGSEAAMSYLTSLLQLQELAAELGRGRSGLPESYQVVVRSRSSNTRSLRAERVALRILD